MTPPSRRALLRATAVAGASTALAGCGSPAPAGRAARGAVTPERHRYGSLRDQVGDLYRPRSGTPRGTVVVVHGGFWQSGYTLSLGAPLSADLARRGWVAWNVEYRRLGDGGGWPETFADVAAAVDHLAELHVDTSRVVGLGHSAGGQLVAWAASRRGGTLPGGPPRVRLSAVVPQAGVLELAAAARSGLGGSSAADLVGGRPPSLAARYREADPSQRLPLGVPVRAVHGDADRTVPIAQSREFVAAARAAGDDARLVTVPGDHFALIDPSSAAWRRTVIVLEELAGARGSAARSAARSAVAAPTPLGSRGDST